LRKYPDNQGGAFKEFGPSSSGKNNYHCLDRGNVSIPGAEDKKIGLNVYRKKWKAGHLKTSNIVRRKEDLTLARSRHGLSAWHGCPPPAGLAASGGKTTPEMMP